MLPRLLLGTQEKLRHLGLLRNKHLPAVYLRAGDTQRLSLQGLMDTDGYVSTAGQCEFTTTSRLLMLGVMELTRTLGYKPSLVAARATIEGRDCGPKYLIQFGHSRTARCFSLSVSERD